jgi:hypothetical protein
MTEEQRIQHEYLLADFEAIKAEIARRSNAQKTALAAVVAFYAWLVNQLVSTNLGPWHICAVWIVVILSYVFYKREGVEIGRLGTIARINIAEVAARTLNIPAENLIPSEVRAADERRDKTTRTLDRLFFGVLFGAIPVFLTVLYVFEIVCKKI